jgi:6-phosphofructo-2-kinase/fructose-2,6-biphosphatase 4
VEDYWSRIRDQEGVYDTVTAEEGAFIKVMNVGERIEVNRIEGGCCEPDMVKSDFLTL